MSNTNHKDKKKHFEPSPKKMDAFYHSKDAMFFVQKYPGCRHFTWRMITCVLKGGLRAVDSTDICSWKDIALQMNVWKLMEIVSGMHQDTSYDMTSALSPDMFLTAPCGRTCIYTFRSA